MTDFASELVEWYPAEVPWISICLGGNTPWGYRFRDPLALWKLFGPSITQDLSPDVSSKACGETSEKRGRVVLRSWKSIWPLVVSSFRFHLSCGGVKSITTAATQPRVCFRDLVTHGSLFAQVHHDVRLAHTPSALCVCSSRCLLGLWWDASAIVVSFEDVALQYKPC